MVIITGLLGGERLRKPGNIAAIAASHKHKAVIQWPKSDGLPEMLAPIGR
jgi:hypothetical protein